MIGFVSFLGLFVVPLVAIWGMLAVADKKRQKKQQARELNAMRLASTAWDRHCQKSEDPAPDPAASGR